MGKMGTREILKRKPWWDYTLLLIAVGTRKKLCAIKDSLNPKQQPFLTQSHKHYTVKIGYEWLRDDLGKP